MKHFKVYNSDWKDFHELNAENACDIIHFIQQRGFRDFTIEWKTPVTGQFAGLVEYADGKITYQNSNFKIPEAFLNIKCAD